MEELELKGIDMSDLTAVGQLARAYCCQFPKTSTRQLARMLRKDHPETIASIESARQAVRYHRGERVSRDGRRTPLAVGARTRAERKAAEIHLPNPEPNAWRVHELPHDIKRWLVLADLHIPYHSNAAIAAAATWAQDAGGADGILINGDLADCYSLSSWLRDPRKRRFPEEVSAVGQVLDYFRAMFKPKAFWWKAGNHEYRLERYLMGRAAELFGLEQFTIRSFLKLDERGIVFVPHGDPISLKKLNILHGDEHKGGWTSPVNPARGIYLKTHECTLVAHQHRTSQHTEPTLSGTDVTCWSLGCLCDLHPDYMPLNRWNWGFGIIDCSQGTWKVENKRIDHKTLEVR